MEMTLAGATQGLRWPGDRPAQTAGHDHRGRLRGLNDAGDAASDALEHLDAIWEAETLVEIDDEAYYDYQVNRPVIRQIDGVTRELVWPSMRISHCRPPAATATSC